jgi:restriction endonuclease Mrr
MFMFPVVTVVLGVAVIVALALTRPRRAIRPEAAYYQRTPGQTAALQGLDIEQFERLCRRLAEDRGLRIASQGRRGPREIEITATDTDPLMRGTYMILGVLAGEEDVVNGSRVLDLASAVKGEQAVKGILITTGYFSEDAVQPLEGPPIELINGPRLLELIGRLDDPVLASGSARPH